MSYLFQHVSPFSHANCPRDLLINRTGIRTIVNDVKVENKIGDAIVHRAIRAHQEGTPWKCCIVIPVLPGFPFPIDHSDASAVSTPVFRVL